MDLLWWDRSTGIRSSMLAVEAIDYHPLLVGAKIQSIPVCRASVDHWVGFSMENYTFHTCTVQGSFLERHILELDSLQTRSHRIQMCWRDGLDAPGPEGLDHTRTHDDYQHPSCRFSLDSPVTSSLTVSGEVHLPSGWSVSNRKW